LNWRRTLGATRYFHKSLYGSGAILLVIKSLLVDTFTRRKKREKVDGRFKPASEKDKIDINDRNMQTRLASIAVCL